MRRSPGGRKLVLYVRLTEEEDRQIRHRAAKQGLSAQRFLIESALSGSAESAAAAGTRSGRGAGRTGDLERCREQSQPTDQMGEHQPCRFPAIWTV